MKHVPKKLEGEENVGQAHPLKEFGLYVFGVLSIFLIIYIVLGYSVEFIANNLSKDYVSKIERVVSQNITKNQNDKNRDLKRDFKRDLKTEQLKSLFKKLLVKADMDPTLYQLKIIAGKSENAFALTGGRILIVDELLKRARSENEVAMVLAHEIGHYHHRHHLKLMGRGLVALGVSVLLSGANSGASDVILNAINAQGMSFGREHEKESDIFALELVNQVYGHVEGATYFFERIKSLESKNKFLKYYKSTHPMSDERIKLINEHAIRHGMETKGKLVPWQYRFE